MSGSDVEHVSGFVDGDPLPARRLSSSSTTDCFYDALSNNGPHDPPLTLPSSPPIPSRSGTTYPTQPGDSDPQPFALPATVVSNGHPSHDHRSSPDPDEFYRPHPSTSFPGDSTGIRAEGGSSSGSASIAADTHTVYTSQPLPSGPAHLSELSPVKRGQPRSVSDTSRRGRSGFSSGPSSVRPSAVRSRQASFKDLINKFNNNTDQLLPLPSVSPSVSREQSRASSPVDYSVRSRAGSRRRDTGSSTPLRPLGSRWNSEGTSGQDPSSHIAPPALDTAPLSHGSLDDLQPSNLLPQRRLFGELLTVDTDFRGHGIPSHLRRRGSEGSLPSPNPAPLDHFDPSLNQTPLTPTAWYLGRTPFLESVSTVEDSNRHRRTRSDIPGNPSVGVSPHPASFEMAVSAPLQPGARTYLDSPHSKSRIPISSRRLNSPSVSEGSTSPKAESPVGGRSNTQTPLPPKGVSRLPRPSPKSPDDVTAHAQPSFSTLTSTPTPRGRREMGYGRSRTKVADKSPLLEAYIAAPPPKKSPPLRSSRPRQPVSHTTASSASRSRVGETVSNLQRQINRERESRNSRPRERRLPELGNVDFATRRQRIQQAFNRTVKENERREEEAAELRRRTRVQGSSVKPEISQSPDPQEHMIGDSQSSALADDSATVIEESADACQDETPEVGNPRVLPKLHVDTKVPADDTHAMTMDSPTLGHPVMVQGGADSNVPPPCSATSCSEGSPVTTFDPEPQAEISQQNIPTSHRTLLNEIMRIRESSPSSSSCDEEEYGFSDNDDKESIPIILRDKPGFDDLVHGSGPQETSDIRPHGNPNAEDGSNRWSMSSWSCSLRNQQSTDDACEGSAGDDLSQLHQSTEDSELATHSCSASSSTPSDTGKPIASPALHTTNLVHDSRPEDSDPHRPPYAHSKTPSLAKLGGWDSKKITQLYLEELARGRDHNLPLDVRASPEPRLPTSDPRSDGRTDSLSDDPVLVSRIDGIPVSDRHSHTASLILRDDWEHASPSIMDWMQVAAEDAPPLPDQTPDSSIVNDGAPTPKMMVFSHQQNDAQEGNAGLGLDIDMRSSQELGPQEPAPPSMHRHVTSPHSSDTQADNSILRETLHRPPTVQPVQHSTTSNLVPLGPVHSTGSSEDSLRRREASLSSQARASSATSLVLSSLEQPRTDASSPSPDQRRLKKRRHVIKELVDTEYTFGRDMKVVDDIYKGTSSSCLDLSSEDIKTLFANSDQIVQFSMTFQDALKEAAKTVYVMPKSQRWSSKRSARNQVAKDDSRSPHEVGLSELEKDRATFIGQAFLAHISLMEKVYAEYLKNHDAANKKLQTLQRSTNVSIWLNECREWASDLTSAWDLDSLLVKPVQRILKYPLLLSELLDSTPSDHPDHASLAKALEEVTNISVRINEMKKRADLVGQVVGRKRKDSDVRMGFSKAFGRRTEKLRQQVGLSDMVSDKEYDALAQRFGDNFFQLQVVMRDAEMYTRETQSSMDRFLEFVTAIESFIDVFQTGYPELEGKWRVFKISVQDIMAATLPEHLDIVRKSVIDPMVTLLKLHDGPQRVMKKRDKRLMDYARFKSVKARGDKADKKTAEQADQFIALNETLKDELPKLYSLTAKLMEACLKNFVQIQTTWHIVLQKKIGPLINSFPDSVQKIVDEWTTRFNFSEAQVLSLGICNGSLLADAVNLVNFNTPSTAPGVSSPRRPSTVHSSSTRAMEESPKVSHDFSASNRSFQSPNVDDQSQVSLGRHRADSAFSSRPAPEATDVPRSQALLQTNSTSASSVTPAHSHTEPLPRLPSLTLDSQFLADIIQPSGIGGAGDEANPSSPAGRYSGFFSSAMPMSDSPQEIVSPETNPTKEPTVLFLAASIYEFNIDRARREAGYPYLTYVAGEIFDVIGEKGELWLARNQDDPTHQVGWIWNKHFAKLST